MKDSKIKISDPEFDFSCEIARRLIEIGQIEKAKKITDGLMTIKQNDYVLSIWAFINLIRGQYHRVIDSITKFKDERKKISDTLEIYFILSHILAGNIREAGMLLGNLKDKINHLNPQQKKAVKFLEAYIQFCQK